MATAGDAFLRREATADDAFLRREASEDYALLRIKASADYALIRQWIPRNMTSFASGFGGLCPPSPVASADHAGQEKAIFIFCVWNVIVR